MSRSYKKNPICADRNPEMKRIYSRKIRRKGLDVIPNGMAYKKFCESYEICDFKFRSTLEEHLRFCRQMKLDFHDREPTEEEIAKDKDNWERWHKRK
jgi:hypothetical protein